jgi:hypothetical protein
VRSAAITVVLAFLSLPAAAQECVTCRSAKCSGMVWIEPCSKTPRPIKSKKVAAGAPDQSCKRDEKLKAEVDFPARVHEGDLLGIRIRASCQAWLVVYYLELSGPGAVLWPSPDEPAPIASPARPALLPSPREAKSGNALQAQLREPGVAAKETFVVFAFADRADFDRLKPAAGSSGADGAAYAGELEKKLKALASDRWAKVVANYTIEPKKAF